MENYDAHWPVFLQGLPTNVMLDHYEELDKLANEYKKELNELIRLKTLQDPAFKLLNKTFNKSKKSPYDEQIEKLSGTFKKEQVRIISKSSENTSNEVSENHQEKFSKEELARAAAAENRKDVTEKKTLTNEEKLAQEKINARDITGVPDDGNGRIKKDKEPTDKTPEPEPQSTKQMFQEQKNDLENEREKFLEEMRSAKERNRSLDREH